jgi:hypothetical protein
MAVGKTIQVEFTSGIELDGITEKTIEVNAEFTSGITLSSIVDKDMILKLNAIVRTT